jgi:sugar phosphate isomerase/epimerase
MLEPIAGGVVDHKAAFRVLQELDYSGWYSIEMKQPKSSRLVPDSIAQVLSLFNNA